MKRIQMRYLLAATAVLLALNCWAESWIPEPATVNMTAESCAAPGARC